MKIEKIEVTPIPVTPVFVVVIGVDGRGRVDTLEGGVATTTGPSSHPPTGLSLTQTS